MRENKDVLVYEAENGRKLFLVALDIKNEVGAIADIAILLEKAKVSIETGFTSTPSGEDGRWSFICEAKTPGFTTDDLTKTLAGSKFVLKSRVDVSRQGILVDAFNFPLTWNTGDRAILLRTKYFIQMAQKVKEVLGAGASVLLYQLGFEHGRPSWDNIANTVTIETKEDLEHVMQIYSATGWGKIEVVEFDRASRRARILMRDNFECGDVKATRPVSHFVRGHLAGGLSAIFGSTVKLEEVSCVAAGAEYCEFIVR